MTRTVLTAAVVAMLGAATPASATHHIEPLSTGETLEFASFGPLLEVEDVQGVEVRVAAARTGTRTRARTRLRTAKPRRKITTRQTRSAKRHGNIVIQGKKLQIKGGNQQAATDPNHEDWIDVLPIDWGSHKPGGGTTPTPPPPPPPDDCMSCD